jgi:hypothetical protein
MCANLCRGCAHARGEPRPHDKMEARLALLSTSGSMSVWARERLQAILDRGCCKDHGVPSMEFCRVINTMTHCEQVLQTRKIQQLFLDPMVFQIPRPIP